ncbi:MAG: PAS domain S-box protein [Deltaproteobacteria bacterium]|nr:PAS domain S-box protein [Deltaproteobacteria bacterium]
MSRPKLASARARVICWKGSIKKFSTATIHDFTKRKHANEALRESEDRFRTLIQTIPSVILHLSPDGRILEFNPEAERFYGRKREDVLGEDYLELFVPEAFRGAILADIKKVQAGEPTRGFENPVIVQDGTERIVAWNVDPLLDSRGQPAGIIAVGQDITSARKAEAERLLHLRFLENLEEIDRAIRQAEDLDKMMADVLETVLSVFESDRAWLLYPCDPYASSWRVPMERTRKEYPGAYATGGEQPTTPDVSEIFQTALDSNDPIVYDPHSGRPLPPQVSRQFTIRSMILMAIYPKLGKPWVFGMHQCSYAHVWTEEEVKLFKEIGRRVADSLSSLLLLRDLKKSEKKFRTLFEESKDTIIVHTPEGNILDINASGVELFGYSSREELLKVNFKELCHDPKEIKRFAEEIGTHGFVKDFECHFIGKDGQKIVVNVTANTMRADGGNIVAYRGILRDVTDRKKLEQELLQAQKMEAIGQLSGGIAHDFNNILTTIMGSAELLKVQMEEDDLSTVFVDNILSSTAEAAKLTQSLLTFSRKQTVDFKPLNLNGLIINFKKFLSRLIGEDIELQTTLTDSEPVINADKGQMEQVLMNLATNARHAMPEGGLLSITTEPADLDMEFVRTHGYDKPGQYVLLRVSDTGTGMDARTREKIFEPFFTTREVGTGLGLSIVYGIVKQHNGCIDVCTELGVGTEFKIYFPLTEAAEEKTKVSHAPETPVRGSETVLLAEDDEHIRTLTKFTLEKSGYEVIEAVDGEDAVEKFKKNREIIRLLISDLVMPRKSGKEVYSELLKMNPSLKALFISGYAEEIIREKGIPGENFSLISKPFSFVYLLRRVREMLNKEYAGAG